MLAFVRGRLVLVEPGERSTVVVDVQGLGIRINVLARLLKTLPPLGQEVQLYTQLLFRDPEWVVYGFGGVVERDLFVELLRVNGVGASLGMALLNTLEAPELVQAILTENVRLLALAPGVGLKTAQRLALELKGKLAGWGQEIGVGVSGPAPGIREDVETALLALGYRPEEIQRGFTQVRVSQESVDAWLRAMIQHLS
ncbi:MAG: Holliday junction branch migration protein RuvA [Thermostichales cyanobacterium BF4_bins_65]